MAQTIQMMDYNERTKAAAAFLGTVFTPGVAPVLKAQADLLEGAETTVTDWLRRWHDAVLDAQQVLLQIRASSDPFNTMKLQQEWLSRAFQRMASDTALCQTATQHLAERAKTWFPQATAFSEGLAAAADATTDRTTSQAAATRAAAKPLREANSTA